MNTLNLKFAALGALAAIAVTTGTLAATAAPLRAAELVVTARTPQARIAYDDLNLASQAGLARLEARVRAATERLCSVQGVSDLHTQAAARECRSEATAQAAAQVGRAIELFAGKTSASR